MAHTPGPWKPYNHPSGWRIYGRSKKEPICVFCMGDRDEETPFRNAEANARLAAAAPDLLAALKTLLTEYADKNATDDQLLKSLGGIGFRAVLSARAAIAKAESAS